jgi:hypothetical protein
MATCEELDRRLKGLYSTFKERLYNATGSRAFNYAVLGTMENPELVEYTRDLHNLLLSEGFPSTYTALDHQEFLLSQGSLTTYDVSNYPFSQDICLQLLPGRAGLIRVSVRHDGWLYTQRSVAAHRQGQTHRGVQTSSMQWGDHIPNVFDAVSTLRAPIEALVTQLHMAQGMIEVRPLCVTCLYCSTPRGGINDDIYCGNGLPATMCDVPMEMVMRCSGYRDT